MSGKNYGRTMRNETTDLFQMFLHNWVKTQHPLLGKKDFPQYDYLLELGKILTGERLVLVPKSRQMLISWIICALTLFRALCEKGAELVSWHLLSNSSLQIMRSQIKYDIKGSNLVEKVRYDDNLQRVYINKTQYFESIAPDAWNFHIGGYQVCEKWLKYRKGRTLTYDDQSHYQDIAVAIKETIRLMVEIDKVIPGWPVT